MFGFVYLKTTPVTYVLHYVNGKLHREGPGLSFWYFRPTSVIAQVPLGSVDVPFVFAESTSDYQEVTIQGDLTYRVTDAKRVAELLDYTVDARGRRASEDPSKLGDRLVNAAQQQARAFLKGKGLRDVLAASDGLREQMRAGLVDSDVTRMLGLEILGLSILAIKPSPDMAKALQAAAREQLLREADEAIYARRNAAVELERTIKQNELETELAVQQKRRAVREAEMAAAIAVEEQREALVDKTVAIERKQALARAEALAKTIDTVRDVDWRTLMAVTGGGADSKTMIAMAFRELAENAEKIGQLNISPDLLTNLVQRSE
ncbi:MAG: SPFH domain-containing protein [Myxococcota bacterium]